MEPKLQKNVKARASNRNSPTAISKELIMHRHISACGPKELKTLQRVFETAWRELRLERASCVGRIDPERLLEDIAERMMDHAHTGLSEEEIAAKVLASLGLGTPATPRPAVRPLAANSAAEAAPNLAA